MVFDAVPADEGAGDAAEDADDDADDDAANVPADNAADDADDDGPEDGDVDDGYDGGAIAFVIWIAHYPRSASAVVTGTMLSRGGKNTSTEFELYQVMENEARLGLHRLGFVTYSNGKGPVVLKPQKIPGVELLIGVGADACALTDETRV